ncbi:hypothetical protein DH86_00000824, partial [Scytalidium sp. 3C]
KPLKSNSRASSDWKGQDEERHVSLSPDQLLAALESQLPKEPPTARLRSMTEPPVYQRVQSALHEKLELEQRLKDIDVIIEERRSLYMSSRATSIYEGHYEPMPLPLPPPPRSFVDRVTTSLPDLQRPRTAPSKIVNIPERAKSFAELSATFAVSPRTYLEDNEESFPPPPLPLVLQQRRPPLRKKKSFTRVSNWLKGGDANDNAPSHFVST